jgi:predicted dehydrogenase
MQNVHVPVSSEIPVHNGAKVMTTSTRSTRRRFIAQTAAAVAAPYIIPSGVLAAPGRPGPNDRITIGFIGCGGRAKQLMDQEKKTNWNTYQHYQQMIEKENLDAVVIATPDHARVLPCIHACQAGLDIYAEKPLTLTINEGRVLVNAVRKYQRVFQVGSQQRTMRMNEFACDLVRTGKIGTIEKVQGICYSGPKDYAGLPEQPIPDGNDWDVWQARTEARPFNYGLQFGWMGWRDYSGGEMTNWGAHGVDQIQWALGKSLTGPIEIWPTSPGPNGKISMRYADGIQVDYELTGSPMGGAVFTGAQAKIEIDRNRFATDPQGFIQDPPDPAEAESWEGPGWIARPHMQNWIDCIKTRQKPNADVEIGHRSITVCHLANIARQVGRKLHWDPDHENFPNDPQANAYLDRPTRKGWELPKIT